MIDTVFDRARILALLTELAERLDRRGVRASVYVIGGAAMSLVFDARRATRDIDSVVISGHGPLIDEVRAMAHDHGLPTTWLNEQASAYVSRRADAGQATVFDHRALIVVAASAEHLLAMKLLAARASDVDDIKLLLGVLGITDSEHARAVVSEVFPGVEMSGRADLLLADILGE